MATGYTAGVASGDITDLRTFVLRCARAFGALIEMRDDDMDAPLRLPEASTYHRDTLTRVQQRREELAAMSAEDIAAAANAEYEQQLAGYTERQRRREVEARRYSDMLIAVRAWEPPTPDHRGLKEFMVQQLVDSIDHDCSNRYDTPPTKLSADEWYAQQQANIVSDVEYHTLKEQEELARIASRRRWIQQLQDSLAVTV